MTIVAKLNNGFNQTIVVRRRHNLIDHEELTITTK